MARYNYFAMSPGLFRTGSLEEHRIPGSFEHPLNYLMDHLDLSVFDTVFRNDRLGVFAYPPDGMLTISCSC
jgi:hypothetical protein